MSSVEDRSATFDVGRALAALFIVGFHHVLDYSPFLKARVDLVLDEGIKVGCLSFFFFCSAYLVSRHTEIVRFGDAVRFWKRRCIRILPLYLLALISFSRPFRLTLLSVVGLNNFIPGINGRNIATLWFVSQLILYYFLYPFFRAINRKSILVAVCLVFETIFWRGSVLWGWDHRLWLYFPLYATGILVAEQTEQEIALASFPLGMGFIALVIIGHLPTFPIVTAYCGCGLIIALSVLLGRARRFTTFFRFTSYASMCAYLFHRKEYHRFVLGLVRWTDPEIPKRSEFLLWMYLVFVPVVFMAGWLIQRVYDSLIRRLRLHKPSFRHRSNSVVSDTKRFDQTEDSPLDISR